MPAGLMPRVTEEQIVTLNAQIPQWKILEVDGVKQVSRTFLVENFRQVMDFSVLPGREKTPGQRCWGRWLPPS